MVLPGADRPPSGSIATCAMYRKQPLFAPPGITPDECPSGPGTRSALLHHSARSRINMSLVQAAIQRVGPPPPGVQKNRERLFETPQSSWRVALATHASEICHNSTEVGSRKGRPALEGMVRNASSGREPHTRTPVPLRRRTISPEFRRGSTLSDRARPRTTVLCSELLKPGDLTHESQSS